MSDENMSGDESAPTPIEGIGDPVELAQEDGGVLGTPWTRRTFLKAAALGTAAAAVFQKGPGFTLSPAAAYANDLSGNPCTANDTFISGPGTVLNEPCNPSTGCTTCPPPNDSFTSTFTALVKFPVHNGTNTDRYCLAIHIPAGFGIPAQDVILRQNSDGTGASDVVPGDSFMYGNILCFPCNFGSGGQECFGNPTPAGKNKCDANQCVTVAWTTSPGASGCVTADQSPPGGQCRHQVICVTRASATLTCKTNCEPTCGQTTTLTASATGFTGTVTYCLQSAADSYATCVQTLTSSTGSVDFTNVPPGTYRVKATGTLGANSNCFRISDTVTINAPSGLSVAMNSNASADCVASGNVTFTAVVTGNGACTAHYAWTVGGLAVGSDSATYSYPANPDNNNHIVKVTVTCGGCTACAQRTVTQCVTTNDGDSGACS